MKSCHVIASTAVLLLAVAGAAQAQGRGKGNDKDKHQQGQGQGQHQQPAASRQDEQRRVDEERQRQAAYRAALDRQTAAAQQRAAQLEQEKRRAQYAAQQQYLARLREQQQHARVERDYAHDRTIIAPPAYRYHRAGRYYETSQYGADLLRQAVRSGYQEGYRAGRADRDDRRPADYRDNFAYQDANYGYSGLYVPQGDYNFYFREGFTRGYQDGYYGRHQYGMLSAGAPAILAGVLAGIVALTALR